MTLCAASGCGQEAIWTTSIYKGQAKADFIIPVCREHGAPMAPHHGVRGLDWWDERATRMTNLARSHTEQKANSGA